MADKTGIEWTDATWNPVTGCAKVSAGCEHCYAERNWGRLQHLPAYAGRAFTDVATHADRLLQPLSWKRPRRIFVNSMSDLFHQDIHDDFIGMVFRTMARAPQHTFQVLTKRAERMQRLLTHPKMRGFVGDAPWPLPNVWIGVSVEDQTTADKRIPLLLQTPSAVRWISAEPLLGPVDLSPAYLPCQNAENVTIDPETGGYECCSSCDYTGISDEIGIDWVVVGGESGPKARPMHPAWARSLRDQCAAAGVPFLFKQWGEWLPSDAEDQPVYRGERRHLGEHWHAFKIGKKLAGRLLDGALHDGYPGACLR